ncbi:MAG: hypothetical protein WC763_03975 [Candidatus Paceibacterota bacterium]|jgi:uncharacterized membrane protein YkgB
MNSQEKFSYSFSRFALFVVYVWFGTLKLVNESPANPLVAALLQKTLPFISFGEFIVILGLFEVAIGILFVMPKMERLALGLLVPHIMVTLAPLFLLPSTTWTGMLTPTLEGQYILKNILIVALGIDIYMESNKARSLRRVI